MTELQIPGGATAYDLACAVFQKWAYNNIDEVTKMGYDDMAEAMKKILDRIQGKP